MAHLRYSRVMDDQPERVTVFRSADHSAEEEAEEVRSLLEQADLSPVLLRDDAPGIPSGVCEVRVPAGESERADQVITADAELVREHVDPSRDLDLEILYESMGPTAEIEAIGVQSVLDANGIPNVFVGSSPYPSLRFQVRVPKRHMDEAKRALADARAAGPMAAEEGAEASKE